MKADDQPIYTLSIRQLKEIIRGEMARPEPKKEFSKYLTPQELADLTKKQRTTIYQLHSNGTIPGAIKVGNRLLFDTETILNWIENGSQKIETTNQNQ